jgi:hypothetical protein
MINHFFQVHCHGGACCGIKHIWNFPHSPMDFVNAKTGSNKVYRNEASTYSRGDAPFYNGAAPSEPASKRLKRVIDHVIESRPSGLIEITLTDYQKIQWNNYVTELGFKVVTRFYNSNSKSFVNVYHLVYRNKTVVF